MTLRFKIKKKSHSNILFSDTTWLQHQMWPPTLSSSCFWLLVEELVNVNMYSCAETASMMRTIVELAVVYVHWKWNWLTAGYIFILDNKNRGGGCMSSDDVAWLTCHCVFEEPKTSWGSTLICHLAGAGVGCQFLTSCYGNDLQPDALFH